MATTTEIRVREIPLEQVEADPGQPRRLFTTEDLAGLAESIKTAGLQQPITVRQTSRGNQHVAPRFTIIMGERRWRAHQLAGLPTIRAIVSDLAEGSRELRAAQVLENVTRKDMTKVEEARAYQGLLDVGMTAKEIEQMVGLGAGTVTWLVKLLRLVPELQMLVELGQVKHGTAVHISRLSDDDQRRVLRRLAHTALGEDQIVAIVERFELEAAGQPLLSDEQVKPLSEQQQKAVRDYEAAIDRAALVLTELDKLDDDVLLGALAAHLPGYVQKATTLASATNATKRRLTRLAAVAATREAEAAAA